MILAITSPITAQMIVGRRTVIGSILQMIGELPVPWTSLLTRVPELSLRVTRIATTPGVILVLSSRIDCTQV